jgi:hypothetical protein
MEILITLIVMLAAFLSIISIFQNIKIKEQKRKAEILSSQSKNLKFIEDTLDLACELPLSINAKVIMLTKKLFCIKKIMECCPNNNEYEALHKDALFELQEVKLLTQETPLPESISESQAIQMIKTLKRIEIILKTEIKRGAYSLELIENELSKISFLTLYLKVNNLIGLATHAIDNGLNGTARGRLEAALVALSNRNTSLGSKWIKSKIELCKNKLKELQHEMVELNKNHVNSVNLLENKPDDTGLSRMFDHKKEKVL